MTNALPRRVALVEVGPRDGLQNEKTPITTDVRVELCDRLTAAGFTLLPGEHPIVPVMLGEAKLAQAMAADLFTRGVHVAPFFFPVVPKGQARIRTQMNAALTRQDLDFALDAFTQAGKATGVLK